MDFPATPPQASEVPENLLKALGVQAVAVSQSRYDYVIEVASADIVKNLQPDFQLLATVPTRCIIVTSQATDPYDCISRVFCPKVGINEDPVTGSAHCALAPYWSERLQKKSLLGYQASARGGIVRMRLQGERVILGGQAVSTLKGELLTSQEQK
jgi:predicted PhzF superfamily epimerase YddE/YHI9